MTVHRTYLRRVNKVFSRAPTWEELTKLHCHPVASGPSYYDYEEVRIASLVLLDQVFNSRVRSVQEQNADRESRVSCPDAPS